MGIFDRFRKNKNVESVNDIKVQTNSAKNVLTKEDFDKIKNLLDAFNDYNILTNCPSYENYLSSNSLNKEIILNEIKALCSLFEFNFNEQIPSKEDLVPYIIKKFEKEGIELIVKYSSDDVMNKYFFKEAGRIEFKLLQKKTDYMIRLEEEKRKEQIKKLDEVSNRFDSIIRNVTEEDRMRAADTMARVKEIENREKKKNALNKMLKAINGISNERLSNEELSLLYDDGYLTEERMEYLYTLGYDLSFLDDKRNEERSR